MKYMCVVLLSDSNTKMDHMDHTEGPYGRLFLE
jgi:hypothetical protein